MPAPGSTWRRSHKTDAEIGCLLAATHASKQGHLAAWHAAKPGGLAWGCARTQLHCLTGMGAACTSAACPAALLPTPATRAHCKHPLPPHTRGCAWGVGPRSGAPRHTLLHPAAAERSLRPCTAAGAHEFTLEGAFTGAVLAAGASDLGYPCIVGAGAQAAVVGIVLRLP